MTRLPLTFLLALLLLLPAAAARAALPPLEASFSVDPAAPVAGQKVTFRSTTTGGGTTPLTLAWDLDDDGQFDDGDLPRVEATFAAGTHVVRLRATRSGVADVAERAIVVAGPAGPTTPAPPTTTTPTTPTTPAETPPPSSPPATDPTNNVGAANAAPVAKLDRECHLEGLAFQCWIPYTKVGKAKTFDASPSTDADGRVVRYEWDLDGDHGFETDTGATPTITKTYNDMNPVTIHLRVTDDRGATAETALKLKKVEPECAQSATFRHARIGGPCLYRYHYGGGGTKKLASPDGTLRSGAGYTGDQYRSTLPVKVNGIMLVPAAGTSVLVNVLDHGGGPRLEILGRDVTATIEAADGALTLAKGRIHWTLVGDRLDGVGAPAGQEFGGLAVTAMPALPELTAGGGTRFGLMLRMPQQFGAPTSDRPMAVTVGGIRAMSATRADKGRGFHFEVRNASIGPLGLDKLIVSYDGDEKWDVEAGVTLPPPAEMHVEADAGIDADGFDHAGADVDFGEPGLSIFGPVFLKRIQFRVEVKPQKSRCVPHIGKYTVPQQFSLPGEEPTVIDYGIPTFALCGEVALVAGPTLLGHPALRLDAGLGFTTYEDRPAVLRAFGATSIVDVPMDEAEVELHADGYIRAAAKIKRVWPGVAIVHGEMDLEMKGTTFNAHGGVEACLEFVDWCAVGGRAVVSSKGIAVCLKIDFEVDDWRPGIGYRWGESPTLYFAGCALGPYKATVAAAGAGPRNVRLRAGLPGAAIALVGRDGPPDVTLTGPKGETITTAGLKPQQQKPFFVLKDPARRLTQIAIVKPSAGTWKIAETEASTPVLSVKTADGLAAPKVQARVVRGRGGARELVYDIAKVAGQKVTFAERGASAGGRIGEVREGGAGRIRFVPADGAAERRRVVAIVEQDGMPRGEWTVARYVAPKAGRPAAPRGLKVVRRGTTLTVAWRAAAGRRVPRHVVTLALTDGRRLVVQVAGARHVVRGVPRAVKATASVRGLGANGMLGATARARG